MLTEKSLSTVEELEHTDPCLSYNIIGALGALTLSTFLLIQAWLLSDSLQLVHEPDELHGGRICFPYIRHVVSFLLPSNSLRHRSTRAS